MSTAANNERTWLSRSARYTREISVALISHVRGQKVFKGLDELIAAMTADGLSARDMLTRCGPLSELDRKLGFFG